MPRIRSIKPEHWGDKNLPKISLGAHLLWISMWNFSDDKGILERDYHLIKSNSFPRRKEIKPSHIKKWVSELIDQDFIIPFEHINIQYLISRTFDVHQKIDKPQPSKIKEDVIRRVFDEHSSNGSRQVADESDSIRRKERIGEDKESIGKESGDFLKKNESCVPNGNYPVPKMQIIWMRYKPDYAHDEQRDYEPLRHIWEFIAKQDKVKKDNRPESEKVLEAFEFISKFVSTHDFFKTYSLKQIDTHIQSIIQNIQNGGTKSKQATGKDVNLQSAFDAIDRHYAKNGKG